MIFGREAGLDTSGCIQRTTPRPDPAGIRGQASKVANPTGSDRAHECYI